MKIKGLLLAAVMALALMPAAGCAGGGDAVKLDPKNPVTITVWHYYNGSIMNAFETLIAEFNDSVGTEKGIILEAYGLGSVDELERAVQAAANKEIGSMDTPNIFASYADTAYAAERLGLLANLADYFTEQEQGEFPASYIEEGRIGLNGELRIFPIAKSTEIMMLNDTDWLPFANDNGFTYDDLKTMEDIARVSEAYYEWSGGKSFFGRDSMANLFIIASKEFNTEIFNVQNDAVTLDVNEAVMRKIWDYYYVPFISGYYSAYGKFRSDDAKVGDLLCYVGATSSAAYFPSEVTAGGRVYPIEEKVLPAPLFAGGAPVMVQQGAGMVVTKSTPQAEYASILFLKWFTQPEQNIAFASLSGYMPVKRETLNYATLTEQIARSGAALDAITSETLRVSMDEISRSELYTNKAFDGGKAARAVLERHLQDKAAADRAAVLELIAGGMAHRDAVAGFASDENFIEWLNDFKARLQSAALQ